MSSNTDKLRTAQRTHIAELLDAQRDRIVELEAQRDSLLKACKIALEHLSYKSSRFSSREPGTVRIILGRAIDDVEAEPGPN